MIDPFAAAPDLLAFTRHGGRLAEAAARFPHAPRPWLDLSTGINPCPYPLPPIPPAAWTRLPDDDAVAALETVAARAYGVTPRDGIVAAPGSQAIIQRLPALAAARRVAVLGRSYGEHAAVWRTAGAAVRTVSDLDDLAAAEVAVVVNPNNPDGRQVAAADLREVAGRLARRGGLLVVDEAYADLLDPSCSLVPGGVPEGAVVLRSFGKVYGLAGIRLGFLVGAPAAVAALRTALGPWAVPGPTIAVGRVALADAAWLDRTRLRLARDAAALDALLARAGFSPAGGTPLFRLVAHAQAAARFRRLAEAGILVRPFADAALLRIGVPHADDGLRLASALEHDADLLRAGLPPEPQGGNVPGAAHDRRTSLA